MVDKKGLAYRLNGADFNEKSFITSVPDIESSQGIENWKKPIEPKIKFGGVLAFRSSRAVDRAINSRS